MSGLAQQKLASAIWRRFIDKTFGMSDEEISEWVKNDYPNGEIKSKKDKFGKTVWFVDASSIDLGFARKK
jgi:hypothetical protein